MTRSKTTIAVTKEILEELQKRKKTSGISILRQVEFLVKESDVDGND